MIIPTVPLLIRVFADRLREDQGRQLGRAVLFASIVGFDVVERRKGDIAAISRVSAARIQEIVDTGRQALNTASPKVREQHVVSRALLRRFLGPTNQGERLLSYNLQFGRARLRAPGAVGKLENFVKIDSRETEQLWGLTEQDLPAAIKAARTRRVLQNPKYVAVIKDAIALHFARSLDTLEAVDQNWQQTLANARAAYLADRPAMEQLFYQKHGYYASGSTVAEEIADDLLSMAIALNQSGAYFRLRVVDLFQEARRVAAASSLEIIWSRQRQFQAAGRDPGVVDRPPAASALGDDAELAPLPGHALVIGQDDRVAEPADQFGSGAGTPVALLRPPGQLTDRHEGYAYLVPHKPGGQRRRQSALVDQRGYIRVEDYPGHGLRRVLVPECL